jgi:hypothetical protein
MGPPRSGVSRSHSPLMDLVPSLSKPDDSSFLRVHLVSLRPSANSPSHIADFTQPRPAHPRAMFSVVPDPEDADIILFLDTHSQDWQMTHLVNHPLRKRYPAKAMVYSDVDRPWCALPGIYVSMPRDSFNRRWQRPWLYHRTPHVIERTPPQTAVLLFSFVGGNTHRIREAVLRLKHDRCLIEDTSGFVFYATDSPGYADRVQRYRAILSDSKYVLCPRGHGTASFRLVETLAAGRVPVIISDQWMEPEGLDWSSFSLRVPESEVESIPHLLEQKEHDYQRMAHAAALAYDEHFAPISSTGKIVGLCSDLLSAGPLEAFPRLGVRSGRWLRLWAADRLTRTGLR